MTIQLSVAVRNARLESIESTIGTSAILKIFTGSVPASCAAADTGTVLATAALPSDWMSAASGGAKALLGNWEDTAADNTGTAGYFRIYNSAGTVCGLQGTVGMSGADMIVDNTSFSVGQNFKVTSFTLTDGNA